MQLVFFEKSRTNGKSVPNFGDQLNSWMWEEALTDVWGVDDGIHFLGIGTIIDKSIIGPSLLSGGGKFIVFSSGVGYGSVPERFGDPDWHIISVRGPLSAQVLALPPQSAITDGAVLLSTLSRFQSKPRSSGDVVFMPHHDSEVVGNWREVCKAAGLVYLSPTADSKTTVEKIRSAKLVLADAMHAAVVADAFRVPWIPLTTSSYINSFKWLDWTLTLQLPYSPVSLPPSSGLEVWREKSLPLFGKRFRVSPPTAQLALEDFEYKSSLRSSRLWSIYADLGSKALCSLPGRVYNGHIPSALRASDRNRYLDSAARALIQASKSPQYLSSDSVHQTNLSRMKEKLRTIPQLMNRWHSQATSHRNHMHHC